MLILILRLAPSPYFRAAAMLLTAGIVFSLVVLGREPIAVNLVPPPWDKLLHGSVFALLAVGIGVASGTRGCRRTAIAFFGTLLIGVLDEWHQLYLPGREAEWFDFAADAAGGVVGAILLARGREKRDKAR